MRGLVVCCVLLLAGCSSDVPDPEVVDWSKYQPGTYQRIQEARQQGDCDTLRAALDWSQDSDYSDFVDDTRKQVGCI